MLEEIVKIRAVSSNIMANNYYEKAPKMIDELILLGEESNPVEIKNNPWNILVIDDDMEVHAITTLALKGVKIHGKGLNLIHAFSSIDGIAYLKDRSNIDLILLDMVMETQDAGLKVAQWLNEESDQDTRPVVILRTGHPGLLTTDDIMTNTHFDGMIEKSRVTYHNLINLLTTMLPDA